MPLHALSVRVRSYELDLFGHVNSAVYMNYLEAARIEALASAGLTVDRLRKEGMHVVVAAAAIRHLAPAHLHDQLDVTVDIKRIGTTSVTFHQTILNKTTSKMVAEAEIVGVFLGPDGRPRHIPEEVARAFSPPPEAA